MSLPLRPVAKEAPVRHPFRNPTIFAGLLVAVLILFELAAFGQVGSSSLSGTVFDSSGAVIPNATVALKNEATNVSRDTRSNSVGYFSFVSIQPGSYTVTISASGFAAWEQRNIVLTSYESKTLPNIALKVATTTQAVTVVAAAEALATTNTGEGRTTLNQNMISQLMIQGRNAGELVKILPGMAISGGGSMLERTQYSSLTTQSNNGVVGRYAANGTQPYGGMQLTIDGGIIVDSGNMGTQTANINQDQVAEPTVRNSSFDAEYAHGPITVSAIGRGGGATFRGDIYTYARGATFNAQDSYLKNQKVLKPNEHYWYPGFAVGGPVLFPRSDFNKNRDKLFFFAGYEYMIQHPVGSLYNYFVPTDAMRNGDFSAATLAPFQGHGWATAIPPCDPSQSTQWWWGNFCGGAGISGGNVANYIDSNGLAYMKTFPAPNADPAATGGFNYQYLDQNPVNRWEMKLRGGYNIAENTRLYVSYNRQSEKDINSIGVWWWPGGSLPYPSKFLAQQISNLWSASLTHVFGPSLTNETTFNYTSFINPLKFGNPAAVDPVKVGMNISLPFDTGTTPMIPNTLSWGCQWAPCMPAYFAPAFSNAWQNGAFGALKREPSLADNLAWVKGSHTIKFGFYWARWGNQQTEGTWGANSGFPQGRYEFDNWAWGTTGNPLADMLIGHPSSFAQTSADPVHTMWFTELAFYAQDQWKVSRRLTLNFGMRFDHLASGSQRMSLERRCGTSPPVRPPGQGRRVREKSFPASLGMPETAISPYQASNRSLSFLTRAWESRTTCLETIRWFCAAASVFTATSLPTTLYLWISGWASRHSRLPATSYPGTRLLTRLACPLPQRAPCRQQAPTSPRPHWRRTMTERHTRRTGTSWSTCVVRGTRCSRSDILAAAAGTSCSEATGAIMSTRSRWARTSSPIQ
jgi:hypothetical protein